MPNQEQLDEMYRDANYIRDDWSIGNLFDDLERFLKIEYRKQLDEWKAEMIGDKTIIKVFREKCIELEDLIREQRVEINRLNQMLFDKDWNETEELLLNDFIEKQTAEKKKAENKRRGFLIKIDILRGKKIESKEKLNIEGAKEILIGEIIGKEPSFRTSKREFFNCPIHEEKTASFCWYKNENKGHCFGCGWHGDPIDLFQKLNNCDFITAVKSLTKNI